MKKFLIFSILIAGQAFGQSLPLRINQGTQVVVKFSSITTPYAGVAGITITGITGRIIKHSDTASATSTTFTCAASGANTCTEIGGGYYGIMFPSSYVDTLGRLALDVAAASAFSPTWKFSVISEADWQINMAGNVSDNATITATMMAALTAAYGTQLAYLDSSVAGNLAAIATLQAAVTDLQARTPAALVSGKMDSSVSALGAGAITAASIATDAITAAKVAADVGPELATALLDLPNGIETGFTLRAWQRLIGATLIGKLSGVDNNTPTFRDPNDTKNRVTSITNSTGRVSVTLDPN